MSKEKFSMENISFGRALQKFRKAEGMTLATLSKSLHTSPGYLSEVERGRKKPGSDLLFALRREFNLDINALLEGSFAYLEKDAVREPTVDYPVDSENNALSELASKIIADVENSSLTATTKIEISASILRMINQNLDHSKND